MATITDSTLDSPSLFLNNRQSAGRSGLISEFFRKTERLAAPVMPNGDVYFPEDQESSAEISSGQEQTKANTTEGPSATKAATRSKTTVQSLERFSVIQKWEGKVLEVEDDMFLAELTTIKGEEDQLVAEIYLEEVDESDLPLLEPGAIFYWSIGYYKRPSGTIRASLIRFRRLPPWNQRQLQKAREEAVKLQSLFDDA
jgi:hypothetical protein